MRYLIGNLGIDLLLISNGCQRHGARTCSRRRLKPALCHFFFWNSCLPYNISLCCLVHVRLSVIFAVWYGLPNCGKFPGFATGRKLSGAEVTYACCSPSSTCADPASNGPSGGSLSVLSCPGYNLVLPSSLLIRPPPVPYSERCMTGIEGARRIMSAWCLL